MAVKLLYYKELPTDLIANSRRCSMCPNSWVQAGVFKLCKGQCQQEAIDRGLADAGSYYLFDETAYVVWRLTGKTPYGS